MLLMIKNNINYITIQVLILLTFLFPSITCNSFDQQNNYYIDSINGNDSNTGTSSLSPWKSLHNLNNTTFQPGDKILFKSGTTYTGVLQPKGSGTEQAPIIIDTFGGDKKALIQGNGLYTSAILLENIEYWEIQNLEITNTGNDRKAGRTGVTIIANDYGECHHIYLKHLDIHDVNGSLIKNEGGGSAILWKNSGKVKPSRFVDLRIENCHLYNCQRNGIISSGYYNRKLWYPSIGVIIRNNLLEGIPGDGIVPIGCDGALIEYNIMKDCPDILPHSEAAAGIWPWSSDNTVIQYNQVIGHNAKWDGQGFDSDWNCQNTIIQYNYSCHNAGGFLLVCNNGNNINSDINIGTLGTIVRYNVSVNDGIRNYPTEREGFFSPVFHITGPVKNTFIYNNIVYIQVKKNNRIDRTLVKMDNWGGSWPDSTLFANNIFFTHDSTRFFLGESTANIFTNNLYRGLNLPVDKDGVYDDPSWTDPDKVSNDYKSLDGFMIKRGSPCYNAGIMISKQPVSDFFGNLVNNNPSIGIHEFIMK